MRGRILAAALCLTGLLSFAAYKRGKWRKKVIVKKEEA